MSRSLTPLRTWFTVAALSLPLASHAQTPPPPPATPADTAPAVDPRTRFNGAYHYAGGAGERSGVETAIEHTIADMNFITRPIARGRLRDKNPVFGSLTIQWSPGSILVVFGGPSLTYRSTDDGATTSGIGVGGSDHITFHQRFENGVLVQVLTGENGSRRNEFVLSPDATSVTMRVTITSGQLPTPLRYSLTYHR